MGEERNGGLKLDFDRRIRLQFVSNEITFDAGLPAYRELDEELGLTSIAAGYPDANDADRLARDPTMRVVVSRRPSYVSMVVLLSL